MIHKRRGLMGDPRCDLAIESSISSVKVGDLVRIKRSAIRSFWPYSWEELAYSGEFMLVVGILRTPDDSRVTALKLLRDDGCYAISPKYVTTRALKKSLACKSKTAMV
jgi:hypothetical protein